MGVGCWVLGVGCWETYTRSHYPTPIMQHPSLTPAAFSYRGISRRQYENGPIVEPVRADRPGNPGRIGVAGGTGRTGASCAPIRYDGTAAAGRRSRFFRACLR